MPKETFKIEGVGTLDISQINSSISKIQSTLSKIKLEPNLATDFTKLFNELQTEAQKFQNQLENGFKTKGDVTGLERTATKISTIFNQLTKDLNKVGTLDFSKVLKIDSSLQGKISGIDEEIKNLNNSIKSITASNLQDVVNALNKLQTQGAKKTGSNILKNFEAGDIQEAINLTDQLIKKQDQYQKSLETKGKGLGNIKANREALEELKGILDSAAKEVKNFKDEINSLESNKVKELSQASENLTNDFDEASRNAQELRSSITSFTTEATSAASAQQRFNDEVNEVKNNIANFFSLANGIELVRDALRSAFETVKELDAAMTETAVVTDFSVGDMWNQLPTYTKTANELGATTLGAYKTMTLFYQQGLEQNEAFEIGTETMKMARIAELDYAKATDLMTAALRGFNMELNEISAQRVNDVYSELAAVTASDTKEIGVAMSKTASIASSANMEFETTAAFLAQIIETTREAPETAGTAMKTIIARFTEVKELFDQGQLIGEDSEGQEININKIDEALKTVGISLKDFLTGTKGLDDILLELADKWDSLDLATQRYIATTAAGSRQQSRFLAMMGDYDRTMELVDAAYNSTGASQAQFDKTLESLEAKLNKLSNAWNAFTMGLADNEIIKTVIDALTTLLNGINSFADSLPDAAGAVVRFLAAFTGFTIGKNVLMNITSGITSLFNGKELQNQAEKAGKSIGERWREGVESGVSKLNLDDSIKAMTDIKNISIAQKQLKSLFDTFDNGETSLENFANEIKITFNSLDGNKQAIQVLGTSLKEDLIRQLETLRDTSDPAFNELKQAIDRVANSGSLEELENNLKNVNNEVQKLNTTNKNTNLSLKVDTTSVQKINKDFGNFTQTTAQIASGISDVGSLLTTIGGSVGKFGLQITGLGSILGDIVGIVGTVVGVFNSLKTAAVAAGISMAGLLGPIALVVGAFAALGGIAWALDYTSEAKTLERELKKTEEATEKATTAAKEAKTAYDEVISAFDSYHSAVDKLDELTTGTLEWKEALLEVNQQVMDIINKYPDLAQFVEVGENGQLILSEEGEQQYVDTRQQAVTATTTNQLSSEIANMQAQYRNDLYNFETQAGEYMGTWFSATGQDILDLYNQSPEAFITQSFDTNQLANATSDELIRLFEQNVLPLSGSRGLEGEYLKYDEYGQYQGIVEGQEEAFANMLRDSSTWMGQELQYSAESGRLTLFSDELWNLSDGIYTNAQGLSEFSSEIGEFAISANQAKTEIQGMIESLLTTNIDPSILENEFGSTLTDTFASLFSDSMTQDIQSYADELNKNNNLSELQELYANAYSIDVDEISDEIKNDEQALAEAIASVDVTEQYTNKIESLFGDISNISAEETRSSIEDFFELLAGDFDNLSNESIESALSSADNPEALSNYVETIFDELGYTINENGVIEELGVTLDELTSKFTNAIQALQDQENEVNQNLEKQLYSNGTFRASRNSQETLTQLQQLDIGQKDFLASISEQVRSAMGERSSSEFMGGMLDIYVANDEAAAREIESALSNVDLSNPIEGFNTLNSLMSSTNERVASLGVAMMSFSGDAYGAANQFKYFMESADFSELTDEIEDFEEENGKLNSDNIRDLTQQSALLAQMLDQTGMSATTAAELINSIRSGALGIDDVTDSLLRALDAFNQTEAVVDEAFDIMNNTTFGRDTGEPGEWLHGLAQEAVDFYESGEYGNERLQSIIQEVFGVDAWNEEYEKFLNNAEYMKENGVVDLADVEKTFIDRIKLFGENTYSAWKEFATNSVYQQNLANYNQEAGTSIGIGLNDDGSINVDVGDATTNEMVAAIEKAYEVSHDTAVLMLNDIMNYSGQAKAELARNDWKAGVSDYVQQKTGTYTSFDGQEQIRGTRQQAVFSDKEIADLSAVTGMSELEIWKDVAAEIGVATDGLETVSQIQTAIGQKATVISVLNEDGTIKTIGAITDELNAKLGGNALDGLWANAFLGLRNEGSIAIEDIYNQLSQLGFSGEQLDQLAAQAITAIQESGADTTFTLGNVKLSEEGLETTKTSVTTAMENGVAEVDPSGFTENLAGAIGTSVAESLSGVSGEDWFSGLPEGASNQASLAYDTLHQKFSEMAADSETTAGNGISEGIGSGLDAAVESATNAEISVSNSMEGIGDSAESASSYVSDLQSTINNLKGKNVSLTVSVRSATRGIKIGDEYVSISAYARGSSGLPKDQVGIVGDGGGPELILSKNGDVRLGGVDGATFAYLKKGDKIYTAEQTKDILQGTSISGIPKFFSGFNPPPSQTSPIGGSSSSSSSSSSSNKTSSSSSSSKKEAEEEKEIWENTYDWLYNLTEDINEALRERERIERRYDEILKDRSTTYQDLLDNVYDQLDALQKEYDLQEEMLQKRTEEMQRYLKENQELSKYATFNWGDQTIEINWDKIDKVTDVDTGDRIEEYISKLEEIQEEMESANDSLYDIKDSMQELEDIGKEDFLDFEQRVMDAVIGYYQDQIDELSLIDESINDANTKLMDSIRNSVDQMRQQRENEQTEQSLSDKERRLAYLRQDTSGGNQLEIKQLEEEIANERQNYTDSLVDQKLQEFENQNNFASEQRQKQIELAQASLDMAQETGDLWKNVQELIKAGVDAGGKLVTGSQLDKLLKSQEGWAGLSNTQKMDWLKEIEQALKISGSYYEQEKDDIYGNSYNPNIDYTQKILDMLNSGNIDYHQLAVWEQQRNAKIIAEGMDVPLRYEYVQYLSDYDPSVDYTQKVYDYLAQGDYLMAAISQLQRNQKIKDLGLDYTLEYDLLPYLIAGNTDNPLLDYSDYEVDYGGYLPRGYSLDAYDSGYAYLMSSEMPTYGNTSYYQSSGDNYYEIHIDVESLSSDYDVDQIADKVKRQINEDARYRNVNAINRLR